MPENTARITVTFSTGSLPLGTHARFTHAGAQWVAYPATKLADITNISDRLLGVISRARKALCAWIITEPHDAARVAAILKILAATEPITSEAYTDKTRARTS